jgi:NAD(P)-dependent dehydrogenase (short-subunit alcohol dehydrogenase family)
MSSFRTDLLDGQAALVTGGGTGIGRGIAQALRAHGATVAVASRSHAVEAAKELGARGYAVDVRDPAACEQLVEAVERDCGPLDILVNNAAGNFAVPVTELSPNGWRAVAGIVLDGTFYMSKAAGKRMLERGRGSIVNIVTTYAWTAAPFTAHSGAAKAGVLNLTRSLAVEWGARGVRVNAIAPGPIVTEGASQNLGFADAAAQAAIAKRIPLHRLGEAEDIANAVLYLSSPAARWVTGSCMVVDGGQWLVGGLFDGTE